MVDLVKDNINNLRNICKKHHVTSLFLIGSATNPEYFTKDSDIDFLYKFNKNEIPEMEYADNYFDLLFGLQDLFQRKIDLVSEEKLSNPYFISSINKQKELIYVV